MKLLKAAMALIVFFFGGPGHCGFEGQQTRESGSLVPLRG